VALLGALPYPLHRAVHPRPPKGCPQHLEPLAHDHPEYHRGQTGQGVNLQLPVQRLPGCTPDGSAGCAVESSLRGATFSRSNGKEALPLPWLRKVLTFGERAGYARGLGGLRHHEGRASSVHYHGVKFLTKSKRSQLGLSIHSS
jgi:hypothetical protein